MILLLPFLLLLAVSPTVRGQSAPPRNPQERGFKEWLAGSMGFMGRVKPAFLFELAPAPGSPAGPGASGSGGSEDQAQEARAQLGRIRADPSGGPVVMRRSSLLERMRLGIEAELGDIYTTIPLKAAKELRLREGWKEGEGRWVLLAPDGRLVGSGTTAPTVQEVVKAFREAGLRTRAEVLQAFLKDHPDHAEARCALLGERLSSAHRRLLVRNMTLNTRYLDAKDPRSTQPASEAEETEKEALLAPSLELLDDLLQQGLWKENLSAFAEALRGRYGTSSNHGALRRRFDTLLPEVETLLERAPSNYAAWNLWNQLIQGTSSRRAKALLERLKPPPQGRPEEWPPATIRSAYLEECRQSQDWKEMESFARHFWERELKASEERVLRLSGSGSPSDQAYARPSWFVAQPLLEALLFQGRTAEAEALLMGFLKSGGDAYAAAAASSLARRAGLKDLAEKWQALEKEPPRR